MNIAQLEFKIGGSGYQTAASGQLEGVLTQLGVVLQNIEQGDLIVPSGVIAKGVTWSLNITSRVLILDTVGVDSGGADVAAITNVSYDSRYTREPVPNTAPYPSFGDHVAMIAPKGLYRSQLLNSISWPLDGTNELLFGQIAYSAQTGYYQNPFPAALAVVYFGAGVGRVDTRGTLVAANDATVEVISPTGAPVAVVPARNNGSVIPPQPLRGRVAGLVRGNLPITGSVVDSVTDIFDQ